MTTIFFTVYHEPAAVPLAPLHAVELALAVTIAEPSATSSRAT